MQNINSISVSNNVMQATVLVRQKKRYTIWYSLNIHF